MKGILVIITILAAISNCYSNPKPFEYIIKGTVIGEGFDKLYFNDDYMRAGSDKEIKVKKGGFEIKGTSESIHTAFIRMNGEASLYSLVVEPGEIIVEINTDSFSQHSETTKGENSIAVRQSLNYLMEWSKAGIGQVELRDSLKQLILDNKNNFASIHLLYMLRAQPCFLDTEELGELLNGVTEPKIKASKEFKLMNSYLIANMDSINTIGKKAKDFDLQDQTGAIINFSKVSSGKFTLVERSGSWCYNSTIITQSYRPVYEKYKNRGFEIITVVGESNYKRWKKWVRKEKLPWKTLVELEHANYDDKLFSELLFINGNYLVNDKGEVIATNLTLEKLEEILSVAL